MCPLALIPFLAGAALAAADPWSGSVWPVVLSGRDLGGLVGRDPARLAAFRYAKGWQPVPVQVDERHAVDFSTIYGGKQPNLSDPTRIMCYADPDTFVGPDPDPLIDADDEVVLMARDAGGPAPAGPPPAGVEPGSGVCLTLGDPAGGNARMLYLFQRQVGMATSVLPAVVDYRFRPVAGDYRKTYNIRGIDHTGRKPANPEDSTVSTAAYTRHFSDRWISDGLAVLPPLGTGVNLIDREKVLFSPTVSGRTENTFASGEGAFIANRSGPVRAIRNFIGANSGPTTERCHIFYERLEVMYTTLRVHAIPGIMDLTDYGQAARGMRYQHNAQPNAVTIDGRPDAVAAANPLQWELVSGPQGALVGIYAIDTDIPTATATSYYRDQDKAPDQFTGDTDALGTSGPWYNTAIPMTGVPPAKRLVLTHAVVYAAAGTDATQAAAWDRQWRQPATAVLAAWPRP